jgi:hypothetical protein
LSNYLNGAERVKGWNATETELITWLHKFHRNRDLSFSLFHGVSATNVVYEVITTACFTEVKIQTLGRQSSLPKEVAESAEQQRQEQQAQEIIFTSEIDADAILFSDLSLLLSSPLRDEIYAIDTINYHEDSPYLL